MLLRIKDWIERFEAPREKDRPRKAMDWIRLPCDLQSTGYGMLMQSQDGAQHLGVFVALIELVAALPGPIRNGGLVNQAGAPLSVQAISIKTRISASIVSESIAALTECGWLVSDSRSFQETPGISGSLQETPGISGHFLSSPGGEGEGEGEKHICATPDGDARVGSLFSKESIDSVQPSKKSMNAEQDRWFEEWWAIYWRHIAKAAARKAFDKHVKSEDRFRLVMDATRGQSPEMLARDPDKRPYGASWLNGERWNDDERHESKPEIKPTKYFDPASILSPSKR